MKKMNILLPICLLAMLAEGCKTDNDVPAAYKGLDKVAYAEETAEIANPERGWYVAKDFTTSSSALSKNAVESNYTMKRTLFYLGFYLTDFMQSDISDAYLQTIRTSLQALRDGGCKCILRFAYKDNEATTNKPWDATEAWVLRHIEQLKPIFREYGDVIYVLQAGFVGVWGEWYYTDNFVFNPSKPADYLPRKRVLEAELDAMPKSRTVAVRTPAFKMNIFGLSYADTLTNATAYNGSDISRVGGHNDCFVASSNDYGTFDSTKDREFWASDTKYVPMGGETCNVSQYCQCANTLKDMASQHWSYLNSGYNSKVLAVWRSGNCYDEVTARLGYRLVLKNGYFQTNVAKGGTMRAVLEIANDGFAAPVNPRDCEFVLVSDSGRYVIPTTIDPRFWSAGQTVTIDTTLTVPSAAAAGTYTLCLNLPDPETTLRANPRFSIRLANKDTWDASTGYNKLTRITVE